jgi:hypothetical protein
VLGSSNQHDATLLRTFIIPTIGGTTVIVWFKLDVRVAIVLIEIQIEIQIVNNYPFGYYGKFTFASAPTVASQDEVENKNRSLLSVTPWAGQIKITFRRPP